MLQADKSWDYKFIGDLGGGLNADRDASALQENELTLANNVVYEKGIIGPAKGYKTFLGVVRGNPRRLIQYTSLDSTTRLLLVTNDTVYEKSGDQWFYVSAGPLTELSSSALADATSLDVNDSSAFSVGEHIGIDLDDGTQHQTTIATIPDSTTITIDDGLASAASAGNDVLEAPALSGLDEEYVDFVVMTSQDWVVITNGVDIVKRYDGSTLEDVPNLPSSGNVICKLVALVGNYLCLYNTTEGGNRRPHRVRYSDKGDPTNWSTGGAGFTDLIDTEDLIIATEPLGPYQIIYKEKTIIRQELVETTDKVFEFPTTVSGEGAISSGAVAVEDDLHTFIGRFNLYRYSGGPDIEPVGDKIFDEYFSSGSNINREEVHKAFAKYIGATNEVWFVIPVSGDTFPSQILRLDRDRDFRFTVRNLRDRALDAMVFSEFEVLSYNDLSGSTYNDLKGNSYNSLKSGGGEHSVLIVDPINDQIMELDRLLSADRGEAITYDIATRDFGNPRFKSRLDSIDIQGRTGTDFSVQISTDRGLSYIEIGTFNSSGVWDHKRFHFQTIFELLRVRITGSGDNSFLLKSLGIASRIESDH